MSGSVPSYDHIVVVVEENKTPAEIQANAPYIDSLVARGATLTNYSAITHPSEPNYFAMFAGNTMGVTDDGTYDFSGTPTLVDSLAAAGKSFTGFVEAGSPQKHNPWESFGQSYVEKDMSAFPSDFSQLPDVSFVIPNLNDDMHDGTVAQGDAWLRQHLSAYETWAEHNNSLLILTSDEDDGSGNNTVLTTLDGANIIPGTYGEPANDYSLLRTITDSKGVSAPGYAADASPFFGMFTASSGSSGGNQTGGSSPPSTGPVSIGSGPDTLALSVSEDAWNGDAQFTVSVDGTRIGGTQTAKASHASGQDQTFNVLGSFGPGNHTVSVDFLNDAYGGTSATDRNLYVDGATIDGANISGASLSEYSQGSQSFSFHVAGGSGSGPAPVALGSGPDTLALQVSEDAWNGDAQFTVAVDGRQVGGPQTATASHAAGQAQEFDVQGTFGAGNHTVTLDFLNDAWGGTASTDRNLYLASATINGAAIPAATLSEYNGGPQSFDFTVLHST
ncbi:MAG: hypothetical protein JOZ42_02055 [Acetobacteraceae bacterium]|nr:hypothetical protein [Acetobacteraceae bacterium]